MEDMDAKSKVLFLCSGNSCRSQMAEGLLRNMTGEKFEIFSAGLEPAQAVNPMAVEVMKEIGIDISNQQPKSLKEFLGKTQIQYLIIVCDKANQSCPRIWPGLLDKNRLFWPFDDPANAEGSDDDKLEVFRKVRDEIKEKISSWLKNTE